MVRSFDVKSILRPISVKPEHQLAFVEGGRKIAHDLQANFTIDMVMTPCVAENNDVEDILKLVGRCSWKNHTGKVMLPWEEAYQRGQLVKRLDHLGDQRSKRIRTKNEKPCVASAQARTGHRQATAQLRSFVDRAV